MLRIVKKYRCLIIIAVLLVIISSIFFGVVSYTSSKYNGVTIVLDAGHGGLDVK